MARANHTELVDRFEQFYRRYYADQVGELAQNYPNEKRSLYIDWNDLYRYDTDIADDYLAQPKQLQEYAEEALRLYDLPVDVGLGQAHVRVQNLPEITEIGEIRSRHVRTLVSLRGTVERASAVRSKIQEAAFECQRCGTLTLIPQSSLGETQEPHECQGCERQGPFRINVDHSEYIDRQTLLLKRRPGNATKDGEASIVVTVEDDIAGDVAPGETVTVTGIVRILNDDHTDASIADKIIDGLSVVIEDEEFEDMDITDEDKESIVEQSNQSDIYDQMVSSVAPSIYGYEEEKLAMILQLFGGVTKHLPDGTRIRGDIHIALFGDPGPYESRLLDYAGVLSPRTISASGSGSSSVGLTASMKRTKKTSRGDKTWAVEAGALPLADRGLACLESLDKFNDEQGAALIDVLEDQTVKVNKATVSEQLKARASVLASAHPKYGRFDQYEPIGEQLDLEPELISQFDLIFTVTDQPDPDHDARLAEHILQTNFAGELNTQRTEIDAPNISEEQVRSQTEEITPAIDAELLRKYIAYAKSNIYPTMKPEARQAIRDFYVDLRSKAADEDAPVPVSARKLEALVRLAEASARVRLSDTVEQEDADRVIDIVQSCLKDIGVDPETGQFDADVVETGTSREYDDKEDAIKHLIEEVDENYDKGAPVDVVLDKASEMGMEPSKVEYVIEQLKQKGEAYEPSTDYLRST
ncbi:minichromosome maintenance protein MCM [Haladaptatus cibarius]|uniref:minichromosome maintenance protein MCM n=1 Tax=Haladaptatus cibarius TaxID=453847 RepID=UPI000678A01E|nr:minichromosome maintenance protein MCM [Haladaptatus cibarius]